MGGGRMRAKAVTTAGAADVESAKTNIREDKTISQITREELLGGLKGDQVQITDFTKVGEQFAAAREGRESKFKNRQFAEQRRRLLEERPGTRQTIL